MLLDSAKEFLRKQCQGEDRLLLAVSGGADSLAMLVLLSEDEDFRGRIVCASVDHGLRASGAEDVVYLREFCLKREIAFDCTSVNTRSEMKTTKLSLEAAARRVRYRALEEMRERNCCRWILTAHTMDDDAETVLMKLRSNSSWYECTGIPCKRGSILRPFLSMRRVELRSCLADSDAVVREDEHNYDVRFLRVQIRNWLDGQAPETASFLVRCASHHGLLVRNLLEQARRFIGAKSEISYKQYNTKSLGIDIDLGSSYLNGLVFLQIEATVRSESGNSEFRLSAASRRRAVEFASGAGIRARLALPEGVELRREGRRLQITSTCSRDRDDPGLTNLGTVEISKSRVCGATRLRIWQPGETFKPAKRRTRKISDWLRDCGVPCDLRPRVKVVCDDLGIIAVPGLGVAARVLPQANEETLRVQCAD
ncbi:tRNA lysidine(34) synthetase TilS [bacterium]|nr:tRNA lysidine(34) synthetase TilS [bacterium]